MKLKIFIILILFNFLSCKKDKSIVAPIVWNLNGKWNVHLIKYDYTIFDTKNINIIQSAYKVVFLEGIDTVSTGVIRADTIKCGDFGGVSISHIFIDNNEHMHSETPCMEILDRLDFIKQNER